MTPEFSQSADALTDGNFRTYLSSVGYQSNQDKLFSTDLTQPRTVVTAFVVNLSERYDWAMRMGRSYLFSLDLKDDSSPHVMTCSGVIYTTGFQQLHQGCTGQKFMLRRDGAPNAVYHRHVYHVSELRLYQTPNLLKAYEG